MATLIVGFILICIQVVLIGLPFVAPDFTIGKIGTASPLREISIIIALIVPALLFSTWFIKNKKLTTYLLKTVGVSFLALIPPLLILFYLSFHVNALRCGETGYCGSGEPFDVMSTIFLVMASLPFTGLFLIVTLVIACGIFFLHKRLIKDKSKEEEERIYTNGRILLICFTSIFIMINFMKVPFNASLFTYNSPLPKALMDAQTREQCPSYEHCSDEQMDIPSILKSAEKRTVPATLSHYQLWSISLGAMLIQMNGMPQNQLSLIYSGSSASQQQERITDVKTMLKESWDIKDRDTAIEILSWLAEKGHSGEQYMHIYQIIQENPDLSAEEIVTKVIEANPKLQISTEEKKNQIAALEYVKKNLSKTGDNLIYAWDYGRFVFVVRSAYTVGYLTEEEAMTLIEEVGKRVRNRFHSWEEYGENYVVGREWWLQEFNGDEETESIYSQLRQPLGQWTTIPWEWSKSE